MFILQAIGLAAGAAAAGYGLLAWLMVCLGPRRLPYRAVSGQLPVTILKPLCGAEPELEACLRSFCEQDYPCYQIIFGVQAEDDPALAIVRSLRRAYPELEIDIVVDSQLWGSNRKVSNLINMRRAARYERLVLADSDILVASDYLEQITAALDGGGKNTLVTCLYRGRRETTWVSRLGAMFIDDWFTPAVLISNRLAAGSDFVSGATIALQRDTLDAIGGFEAIADELADDHALGARVCALGGAVVLSDYVVATCVHNGGLAALFDQETRWMRVIRSLQPLGYAFLFISMTPPLALLGTLFAWGSAAATGFLCVTLSARIGMHALQARRYGTWSWKNLWLLPVRDAMNVCVWCRGFANSSVYWRGHHYDITNNGLLQRQTYTE